MTKIGIITTFLICSFFVLVSCTAPPNSQETPPSSPTPTPTPTPEETPNVPTEEEPALSPEQTVEPQTAQETTIELPEVIQEVPKSDEIITRNYLWEYGGGEWNWEVPIPQLLYEYYKDLPRPPTQDYSVYVTHPLDDMYIELLVEKIQKAAQQEEYSEYETVEFAVSFIQSLPYTADDVTTQYDEYPRYPIETLVDNGGDCEDTSILLASILNSMGYGVVLIQLPDHCAIGIKGDENIYGTYWEYEGDKYFYLETTNTGWRVGQLPDVYENTAASIFPMLPIPILTHDWSLENRGYFGELEVTVYNLGTAIADNVVVLTGFDAGEDLLWSREQSESFNVEANHQVTVRLIIYAPPPNKHTRLVVQIGMDNCLVSKSHSELFDS